MTGKVCEEILLKHGKVSGVRLTDGALLYSDHVVFNGDLAALHSGLLNSEGVKVFNQKMNNMGHVKAFFNFTCSEATMLKRLQSRGNSNDNLDAFK
jgi:hypothetical protein